MHSVSPSRLIRLFRPTVMAEDRFELWNLRVGYDADRWGVQAFVENLADEEYASATEDLETYYTGIQRSVGRPRWAGVRFDIKF